MRAGLALMTSDDWLRAAEPLLVSGEVDALEWSWDVETAFPEWAHKLVAFYGEQKALYAHGVMYSPFSAEFETRQARWLRDTANKSLIRSAQHVTEHIGYMTIPGMVRGAPLPAPPCRASVTVASDRLHRLADIVGKPVGLENLAMAISQYDVELQGDMIDTILSVDDAPFLLDLHNLYCQAVNFGVDAKMLLAMLPLTRVREIHVSGGRMHNVASASSAARFKRRDTHDNLVPPEVWQLLRYVLPLCPNLEVVFLERLAGTLVDRQTELATDFAILKGIIASHERSNARTENEIDFDESTTEPLRDTPTSLRLLRFGGGLMEEISSSQELALYQKTLVDALRGPLVDVASSLRAASPAFERYADSLDNDMLQIAQAAFLRWAR